jgi:hypothetical protein
MKRIKTTLFFFIGIFCLALITYEFRSQFILWRAIMDGTSGRNREKYMALRDVFLKRYGDENLYHVTNLTGITGISIILGFISILFFLLIFISVVKTPVKSNANVLNMIMSFALMVCASIITFLNLWSLM